MNDEFKILLFLFLSSVLFGFSLTILPAYLSNIGFTPLEYGFLNAIRSATSLVATLCTGIAVDYLGALSIVAISLALCALGFGIVSIPSRPLIFVGATMLSVGGSSQHVSMNVLISRVFSADSYERVYSRSFSVSLIGSSIGGFAGWLPTMVSGSQGITHVYSLSLALSATLMILTLLSLRGVRERKPFSANRQSLIESLKGFRKVCRGVALYMLIAELMISFGASMSVRMAGFYFAKKFGAQSNELGTVNGATNLLMAALAYLAPRISARIGHPIAAYIAMSATSIPMLVALTYAPTFTIAAAIYVARTALMNAASPLYTAFTMRIVDSDVRGKMSSAMIFVDVGGGVIGSIVGGALMNLDLDAPFRATALVYIAYLSFLYAFVVRKSREK